MAEDLTAIRNELSVLIKRGEEIAAALKDIQEENQAILASATDGALLLGHCSDAEEAADEFMLSLAKMCTILSFQLDPLPGRPESEIEPGEEVWRQSDIIKWSQTRRKR